MRNRLWGEVYLRSQSSVFGHFVMAGLSLVLLWGDLWALPRMVVYLFGIAILSLARLALSKLDTELTAVRKIFSVVVLASGLLWGLFAGEGVVQFGLQSVKSTIFLLSACAIVAGGASSLGPIFRLYVTFSILLTGPVVVGMTFVPFSRDTLILSLAVCLFFIFLLMQGKVQHSLVKSRMLHDTLMAQEKERIEAVLVAIPGFVVMIDQDLTYVDCSHHESDEFEGRTLIGKKLGFKGVQTDFVKLVQAFILDRKEAASVEVQGSEVLLSRFQTMRVNNYLPIDKRWFLLSMRKIKAPYKGAILILSPIDELKSARLDLEQQKARSQFSARLSTLGEMAGGIAHEINNPLAVISAAAETIKEEVLLPQINLELVNRMVFQIEKVAGRIAKIVKGLKSFSRQGDRDPFQKTLFETIVQDSLDLCQKKFVSGGVDLQVGVIPPLELQCRPVQISQILLNFLGNAFDAVHEKPNPWVKLSFNDLGSELEIIIMDSGPGIPPGVREKIFEPFFTTKEVGKGTGLGLSISMGIVHDHGGTLAIDDRCPNTCFVVRLPKVQLSQAPMPSPTTEVTASSGVMQKIFEEMERENAKKKGDDDGSGSTAA